MTLRRQWVILGTLTAIYLVGLGMLTGITSERLGFDAVVVTQPATAPTAAESATWASHLDAMDKAIGRRDVSAADRAWREARVAAARTRGWRPLLEVGDAALRLGIASGDRRSHGAAARDVYMSALTRARAERSTEGVLRVADAFHALGDQEVVEQCLVIATSLGARPDSATVRHLRGSEGQSVEISATPAPEQ
jgi:hypothetical protein